MLMRFGVKLPPFAARKRAVQEDTIFEGPRKAG